MAADDVAEEELQAFAREAARCRCFRRAQPSSALGSGTASAIPGNARAELRHGVENPRLYPGFWWTMHFLLAGRVPWRKLLLSAIATGACFAGLGVFSKFYFSSTIISDSRTYGTIGAVFGILTWLIAIAAVIILGAVAEVVWDGRSNGSRTR
jgi:hypothetical protein